VTRYLSTLTFSDEWLDALRERVPGVEVLQIPAEKATGIPVELWQSVDVLHTSAVLPDPADTPRLRWIQLDTSGVDHVRDHAVWTSEHIEICTIGGVSPVPLAQYVLFCLLGFAHRMPAMLAVRDSHSWPTAAERWRAFLPAPLDGATLAIVGYGRIGREIGRLARAHNMTVVGMNRSGRRPDPASAGQIEFATGTDDDGIEVVGPQDLHALLGRADYVVVVVPLTDETRSLLDAPAIAAIKPGAVLINVARGGIVDEAPLRAALRSGALAGAALDVFDDEPLPPDSPWWTEPNVFVTPHVSGLAPRYFEQVLEIVSTNLRRFVGGEPLLNRVDRERGY
jgi:phosphoglycerate dehydrogenase-like enzyme